MVVAGASFLDVGGESTRPGALAVSEQEEMDRVLGAIACIKDRFDIEISLDTSTPNVMLAGAAAGVGMINDVRALGREGAIAAAAQTDLPICLMHMQGDPLTMQDGPEYLDVVLEVTAFLEQRAAACSAAGISAERLVFDPGFGFGKTPQHNFSLLRRLPEVAALGQPVLVGLSRKSMIASVIDRDTTQRMPASLALAVLAVMGGAHILRVHDVVETMDAVAMMTAWAEASL
jgi:dihydropteroate synthase